MCCYSSVLTNKLLCQALCAGRSQPRQWSSIYRGAQHGNQTSPPSPLSSSGTAQHWCISKSAEVPCPDSLPNSGKMAWESVRTHTYRPDILRICLKLNQSQNPKVSQAERFKKTHRNITTILFSTRFC